MVVVVRRYAGRHNVRLRLAELLLVEQYGANRRSRRCSRGTRSQNRIRLGGRTLVVPQRCSGWHLVTGGLQEPWITSRAARCRCSGHRHRGLRESAMVSDDRGLSVLRGSRVAVHSLAGRRGCRLLPQQSCLISTVIRSPSPDAFLEIASFSLWFSSGFGLGFWLFSWLVFLACASSSANKNQNVYKH